MVKKKHRKIIVPSGIWKKNQARLKRYAEGKLDPSGLHCDKKSTLHMKFAKEV